MPLDIEIETTNGKKYYFNIPMRIMRGSKLEQMKNKDWTLAPDWPWTNPSYELFVPISPKKIKSITIDPKNDMADINKENNILTN